MEADETREPAEAVLAINLLATLATLTTLPPPKTKTSSSKLSKAPTEESFVAITPTIMEKAVQRRPVSSLELLTQRTRTTFGKTRTKNPRLQ